MPYCFQMGKSCNTRSAPFFFHRLLLAKGLESPLGAESSGAPARNRYSWSGTSSLLPW
jgi:hypothetical protein